MCGYVGIEEPGLIERMTEILRHRGPDDFGHFLEGDVALGHRRLAVIDLAGGRQPMVSPDGRLVLVFNGEIYNYRGLREELAAAGEVFETESDTEVLLRLLRRAGASALPRLNGMFAFAAWDRERRELLLARDRVGIKPLYYVPLPGRLLFASETKSLLRYGRWSRNVDPHAVHDYLALRYPPGRLAMFEEVKRLEPGHFLRYRAGALEVGRYWSPPEPGGVEKAPISEAAALEELRELLERSVRRRLLSDVPYGAYLSGGLDSSVIAALMAKLVSEPVKTFSVGFDYEHDEVEQAAATARLLGADHTQVECRARDASLLPEIVWSADEPLGDPIGIAMYKLAREAKQRVTVILTGEGADELFGGYLFHKVLWAGHLYRRWTPSLVRRGLLGPLVAVTPARLLDLVFQYPAYLGERGKWKALDLLGVLEEGSLDRSYRHLISLFDARDVESLYTPEFEHRLQQSARARSAAADPGATAPEGEGDAFDRMLRLQFDHWLPDNILLRQDKTSMASAVEARVPYLDHEVVEFAFRLPRRLRLRGLTGKYLLRRLAEQLLPGTTARRRKMPFYVPMDDYFRDPDFVALLDDLLSPESVRRRGLFRPEAIAALRAATQGGEFVFAKQVFSLMTLELWFRTFVDADGAKPL